MPRSTYDTDFRPSEKHRAIMREVSSRMSNRHVIDLDPEDPTQQLDDLGEFHIIPLTVEAQSEAETLEDFDIASAENIAGESEPGDDEWSDTTLEYYAGAAEGTGELYGIRMPHAGDTHIAAPEDQDSYEGSSRGENWLESLEEHATEGGPIPEEEVVIVEESEGHHPSQRRDRPVADKGSGGSGGL